MRILFIMLWGILSFSTLAEEVVLSDPNKVIHSVSENTFTRIMAEKSKLTADPAYMRVLIEEELIPHFDYKYASYKVMGTYLKKTTKEQRSEFVEAFRNYLINAYGHILFEYDQQKVEVLDNKFFQDKKIISVPVKIIDNNEQVTQIAFKLRKNKKTGEWKVFDVIAEGVSMLNTKQSEFNGLMNKKGIDHVIELLKKKNSEF